MIDASSQHTHENSDTLKNEPFVIKSMIEPKTVKNVFEFSNKLIPMADAFPQTLRLIRNAATMPISQVNGKRLFLKMKIIKNCLRTSITDEG